MADKRISIALSTASQISDSRSPTTPSPSPLPSDFNAGRRDSVSSITKSVGDDFLLASLLESGFITGSIKTVFERGKQQTFQQSLDRFIDKQRKEIQTLCSDHYEEFLTSVAQLKKVRLEALNLREKIIDVNDEIQSAGKLALERGRELMNYRTIGENVANCLSMLEKCRFVSSLSRKVSELIQAEKFYPALIILEQLEKELQKPHFKDFKFAEFLEKQIPKQRNIVKAKVESSFNDWLSLCKRQSQECGKLMMQMTEKRMVLVKQKQKHEEKEHEEAAPSLKHDLSLYTNYEEDNIFELVKIDFTPVYTMKHIFETLGILEDFKSYYRHNREIQIKHEQKNPPLTAALPSLTTSSVTSSEIASKSTQKSTVQLFEEWLCRILGYFTVENAVLNSTSSLLSTGEVNEVWERTCQQICICLKELLFQHEEFYVQNRMRIADPNDSYAIFTLRMKQVLVKFCFTVQQKLSLHVAPLLEMLDEQKEKFAVSLQAAIQKQVLNCIKAENYKSLEIISSQHYQTLQQYYLISATQSNVELTQVPFSSTVVELVELISFQYIDPSFSFAQYISPMDELIRLGIVDILTYTNECIEKTLLTKESKEISMEKYAQVSINAEYLAKACRYLEQEYFNREQSISYVQKTSLDLRLLKGCQDLFLQTKARSEDMMLRAILTKIDEETQDISAATYTPKITEQQQLQQQQQQTDIECHPFMARLVAYLYHTDSALNHLPKDKREYFVFKSSQYIASKFTAAVISPSEMRELNMQTIRVLRKDIEEMEKLADKLGFQKSKFCYQDLTMIMDFLIKQDAQLKGQLVGTISENEEQFNEVCSKFDKIAAGADEQSKRLKSILIKFKVHHKKTLEEANSNNVNKIIADVGKVLSNTQATAAKLLDPKGLLTQGSSSASSSTTTTPSTPNVNPASSKPTTKKKKFLGLF